VTGSSWQYGHQIEGSEAGSFSLKEHPAIEKLLEYRSVQKLLSSYGWRCSNTSIQ